MKIDNYASLQLRKLPEVRDGVVVIRRNEKREDVVVIYAVLTHTKSCDKITKLISKRIGNAYPVFIAPISCLPLCDDGEVDLARLKQVPVFNSNILKQARDQINDYSNNAKVFLTDRKKHIEQQEISVSQAVLKGEKEHFSGGAETAQKRPLQSAEDAYVSGGELLVADDEPKILVESLKRTAKKYSNKGICYISTEEKEEFISYSDLWIKAEDFAKKLHDYGFRKGNKVLLVIKNRLQFFQIFWACLICGVIPTIISVPTDLSPENLVVKKICTTWKFLNHCLVLISNDVNLAWEKLDNLHPLSKIKKLTIEELANNYNNITAFTITNDQKDIVFFQLSSGSTGASKCIIETNRNIIAHIHSSKQFNNYTSNEITLNWLPMDHVVPILTYHLRDVYLGYQQIHIETSVILEQPLKWLKYLQQYNVSITWAPNFGFKIVNEAYEKNDNINLNLSNVKYYMNAGEQVTYEVMKNFVANFGKFGLQVHNIQPSFGMAEVATCMTYNNDFDCESSAFFIDKRSLTDPPMFISKHNCSKFIDLGAPTPGVDIRIVDNKNKVVSKGVIGELQIKGETLFVGYYNNPQAQSKAFTDAGWFNTGDLGFIWNNRLVLTGRAKEIIIIRGANFHCYEIEEIVSQVCGVTSSFVAACAVNSGDAEEEKLAIFFVPEKNDFIEDEIKKIIRQINSKLSREIGISPDYIIPIDLQDFPKTTSGKIQRIRLKKHFEAGGYAGLLKRFNQRQSNISIPRWFYHKKIIRKNLTIINVDGANVTINFVLDDDTSCFSKKIKSHFQQNNLFFLGKGFNKKNLFELIKQHFNNNSLLKIVLLMPDFADNFDDIQVIIDMYQQIIKFIKMIVERGLQNKIKLFFVLIASQSCGHNQQHFFHYGLASLVNVINREYQQINSYFICFVDCDYEDIKYHIANELAKNHVDHEVYYKNNTRYIYGLFPTNITNHRNFIKPGGVYILIGGLGGIGYELACHLVKNYNLNLIIIGRREIKNGDEYSVKLNVLAKLTNTIKYIAADISQSSGIDKVKKYINTSGVKVTGIFQMAGDFIAKSIAELSEQNVKDGLASKVIGTINLWQLLIEFNPNGQLICFSSLIGLFGASYYSVYALANGFLESLCAYLSENSKIDVKCISWSAWDKLGMGNQLLLSEKILNNRGYHMISLDDGINSFQYILNSPNVLDYVGINLSQNVMPMFQSFLYNVQQICVELGQKLHNVLLHDQFGFNVTDDLDFIIGNSSSESADKTLKNNAIEDYLIKIWGEVSPGNIIHKNDDFFELGCDSIKVSQIISKINDAGYKVSIKDVFDYSSVKLLANYISQKNTSDNYENC